MDIRNVLARGLVVAGLTAAICSAPQEAQSAALAPYTAIVTESTTNTTTSFGFPASLVQVHNDGAVTIYCYPDGVAVAATSPAVPIPAGKSKSFDYSAAPFSAPTAIGCITASSTASTRIEAYRLGGPKVTDIEAYSAIPTNVAVAGTFTALDGANFLIQNTADTTKQYSLSLSGMTTAKKQTWQLGGTDVAPTLTLGAASATPGATSFSGISGTGTNISAGNLDLYPGISTGTGGAATAVNLWRNLVTTTGTTAQTQVQGFTVCPRKTLSTTTGTAQVIANVAVGANGAGSIHAWITVTCNDGTNFDSNTQDVYQAYVDKASSFTFGTATAGTAAAANNSGSCTVVPTFVANGTGVDIKVTPAFTTIVPTAVYGYVTLQNNGDGAVTCQ